MVVAPETYADSQYFWQSRKLLLFLRQRTYYIRIRLNRQTQGRGKLKKLSIFSPYIMMLLAAFWLVPVSTVKAQNDTATVVYFTGTTVRRHPDGPVGSVSFNGFFQYASVTKPPMVPTDDIQRFQGGLNWVADDHVNLMTRFLATREDSTRYELNGGIKVYLGNPVTSDKPTNPDGAVGIPSFSLWGGIRYNDLSIEDPKFVGDFELIVPVSTRLSVLAGYRYFEEISEPDVQQAWGGINFFVDRYYADSAYANPDGPVGNVAIGLTGGGSSEGVFGDLTLSFPISNNVTWKLNIRGERVEFPYRRVAIVGAGVSLYPSN